jgi:hypothetical protein
MAVALGATLLVYLLVAWLAGGIDIPSGTPTAQTPWLRPFRVIAALGFSIASLVHLPHVIGQFLAAILLGGLLGAVFAAVRHWAR